ncbi:helix-turn-helix domain-containing protein [Anditalea andensis]|uniref:DNA-binding protein n=1 Tax=Anditalea andensis TaxID=1048983 RepID=A0A074L1D4_9BACT|nr:AraC family transcriptional regulator [Anditalea andensis]KEO74305.1 DNA-binding protein [Anditalea andensis]
MKENKLYPTIDNSPGESGVWWHEQNLGPLENLPFLTQFGSMKFSKVRLDENMRPHLNDGIEIHFIESGKYDWRIEEKNVELFPDDLSITAPWHWNGSPSGKMDMGQINWLIIKPHEYAPDQPLNFGNWTSISEQYQIKLGKLIAAENGIILRKAKLFKKHILALKEELLLQAPGYELVVRNIIENLLIDLYRHLSTRKKKIGQEDCFISKLTEMINDDLTEKWIVEDLAYSFGMGKTKFTDEVKRLTGYPPSSFIIHLKIERAKQLLTSAEELGLSDIAYQCGFSSLQHFTSAFRQRTGTTPSKYQQNSYVSNV